MTKVHCCLGSYYDVPCTADCPLSPAWPDAIAWAAYSRAWPDAMAGRHLHARGWQQPRVIEYARPQGLEWEEAQLPDMLAASEHAEPSGEDHDRP